MPKTRPFFKLAASALGDKRRNPTQLWSQIPTKDWVEKEPPVNSIRYYCSKALGSPCLKGCLCNLSKESDVQYWNRPSLAGWSLQQLIQTQRASIGKVGGMLKLTFWGPSGKGGKWIKVHHVIWRELWSLTSVRCRKPHSFHFWNALFLGWDICLQEWVRGCWP